MRTLRSIVHPTDFSALSHKALAHALRIALSAECKLSLLHVAEGDSDNDEIALPWLHALLAQWDLVREGESATKTLSRLKIDIESVRLEPGDPAVGITDFLGTNRFDIVVLATHGRDGIERWMKGSIAERIFKQSETPTLFVSRGARGFVSDVSGLSHLRRILVPVDYSPSPEGAVAYARNFAQMLGDDAPCVLDVVHVGATYPQIINSPESPICIPVRSGSIATTIIDLAVEFESDLICMATAGRNGIVDVLRGSTTERVLRHAPCPLLAIPAKSEF